MALVHSDPFRDVDRLFQQLWGSQKGNGSRTMAMPMAPPPSDGVEVVIAERPYGTFTRQVFLDTEHIQAEFGARPHQKASGRRPSAAVLALATAWGRPEEPRSCCGPPRPWTSTASRTWSLETTPLLSMICERREPDRT